MKELHKAKIDVPVAIVFFIRPETLKQVFQKVKNARPSKLFLIQDGERIEKESDNEKVKQCRDIVEDIDWECEVYKNYSNENLGCGVRPHTGISWMFEHVDRAIILEDDCVPADSFFPFCKDMLEKYKDDSRVGIVSGLNYFEQFDFGGYSYGFVKSGAIWGWATWKNRWDKYQFDLSMIDEEYISKNLMQDITPKFAAKKRLKTWNNARKELEKHKNVSYWDYQWGFTRHVNSWLSIVPKYNLITNIGIGMGSTHSGNSIKLLPKKIANFFFMDISELEFPLKHPNFILPDRQYDKNYYKIIYPNVFAALLRKISSILKKIYYK